MHVYISSSWKNRERVRALAKVLRDTCHTVYDFTDPACRGVPEIPPERFPDQFDPAKHVYRLYLQAVPEWRAAVMCNQEALKRCDTIVLLLPAGNDSHADAYYALGLGKRLYVCGHPNAGDRTPTHLWADRLFDNEDELVKYCNGGMA